MKLTIFLMGSFLMVFSTVLVYLLREYLFFIYTMNGGL